jgi:mRNA interferase HigB
MMDLIGKDVIYEFQKKHPKSKKPLNRWLELISSCIAKHPMDLRQTFGSVDPVPPQTVFDVAGNDYRIITEIDYSTGTIIVTHVLTHQEYDKGKWRS